MKTSDKEETEFKVTDKFKTRAVELLDESHAMQFAEGLRLNNALATMFSREEKRLARKYGGDDERTREMADRLEASAAAKVNLFARYTDAMTPLTKANQGWAADGFVRGPDGRGVFGLTVAAYDRQQNKLKEFGQASTDDQGYFSITVDKLPEKLPGQVFIRAMKGRTLLPSNEVSVAPRPGVSERVEINITDKRTPDPRQGGDKPADKPAGKPADKPIEQTMTSREREQPTAAARSTTSTSAKPPAKAKRGATTSAKPRAASKPKAKAKPNAHAKPKAKAKPKVTPAVKKSGRAGPKKPTK
jgi:hypothetical protein